MKKMTNAFCGFILLSLTSFSFANTSPTFTSTPVLEAQAGKVYSYILEAEDADGDVLSFSLDTLPSWLRLDTATAVVTTFAGSGEEGELDGRGSAAWFNRPYGVAVDASTIAIFKDSVEAAENIIQRPSSEEIERAVSVHEAGHLLGLVNLVYESPIDHEDPDHPGHSNNDNSVMYWAIETNDVGNLITGNLPNTFDADDKSDLAGMADGTIECSNQIWP